MSASSPTTPPCPPWCTVHHGARAGVDDGVHLGGVLMVQHTLLRLVSRIDPYDGDPAGPHVLLGAAELTLHEAEALIAALTQLVDQARGSLLPQQP